MRIHDVSNFVETIRTFKRTKYNEMVFVGRGAAEPFEGL